MIAIATFARFAATLSGIAGLLCLVAGASQAQTAELSIAGGTISFGRQATFILSLRSTSGPTPAAIQWNLEYSPSVITDIRIDGGPMAGAADKTVFWAETQSGQTCLAMGLNANAIPDGTVAAVTATLAPGVLSATIVVTNTVAVSAAGNEILLTAPSGGAGTVTISPPHLLKPPPISK